MAKARKSAIEGKTAGIADWSDDTIKLIGKALGGGAGAAKKKQAQNIVKKGMAKTGYQRYSRPMNKAQEKLQSSMMLGNKVESQLAKTRQYRKRFK